MPAAIHDVRFPDKILRGAVGGPKRSTTVGTTDGGFEQRNQNWLESKRRWVVARKITSREQLEELLAFWECRGGKANGFLFRDPSDFFCGLDHTPGAGWTHDGAHNFDVADGIRTSFHLAKVYSSGAQTLTRQIHRPLDPTRSDAPESAVAVKVYVDDVEVDTADYTLSYATGTVTFDVAPADTLAVGWSGMFDIAARFDTDEPQFDVDAMWKGKWDGIPIFELKEADLPSV